MGRPTAHIGTISSHGGVVITGAFNVFICSLLGARCGDLHACPLKGHGVTPIVTCSPNTFFNSRGVARQFDVAGCGAMLMVVCPTVAG